MKVLVTGATGFIGRHVILALGARGATIRAALRSPESAARLAAGAEPVLVGDLAGASWTEALRGVDVVVHLAALVHQLNEPGAATDRSARYHALNVAPTTRLADAALAAGVRRFVFASSVKAQGEGRATPYRDGDAPEPADPYGRSKLEAEAALAARISGGLEPVSLRPPLVHGEGVGGNFRRLLKLAALSTRVPLPLGDIHNRRTLIYVENLADAFACAATSARVVTGSFLVGDAPPVGTSGLLARLAAAVGRRARLVPMPGALAAALRLGGFASELQRLTGDLTIDDSRFRELFGWSPPVGSEEGLARTARAWDGW